LKDKWSYMKSEHKKPLHDNTTPEQELDELQFL